MLYNKQNDTWYRNRGKRGWKNNRWADKQKDGSVWTNKNGPIQAIRYGKVNKQDLEIKEYQLVEL